MEKLTQLCQQVLGQAPIHSAPITGSGSPRTYYRMTLPDGRTIVGVVGTDPDENDAFWEMTQAFLAEGLHVPQTYARSTDHLRYLQQDLGTRSLYDFLAPGREAGGAYTPTHEQALRQTMQDLAALQMRGAQERVLSHCHPIRRMDEESVWFDLNYFKYCFVRLTGIPFNECHLQADFRRLARRLLDVDERLVAFQYRDFQARNVMLPPSGTPHFIDYQGGRQGPVHYDVASFLWQASARYPAPMQQSLVAAYIQALQHFTGVNPDEFNAQLAHFVLFRTLQVLGAYGLRGLHERKPHFLNSIPHALRQLNECLAPTTDYPTLASLAQRLTQWQRSR